MVDCVSNLPQIITRGFYGYQGCWGCNDSIPVETIHANLIVFAAIFGTLVPLLLDKYKIDPALATGPFITTVNDVFGLFLYLFIGYLMYAA